MKNMRNVYVFVAVLVGVSAYAKESLPEPVMQVIDRNGDGSLQQAEIDMAVTALRSLDRNEDGTVSPNELAGHPNGRPEGRPPGERSTERPDQPERTRQSGGQNLARLDADGDGKISKAEAPERMKERFDMIDANGDGFLDKKEQEQLMQRMRDRGQQPGQGQRSDMSKGGKSTSGGEMPKRPDPID